jgi:hypothetical protein
MFTIFYQAPGILAQQNVLDFVKTLRVRNCAVNGGLSD